MKNVLLLALVIGLAACGGNKEKLVKIKTSHGEMTVLLYDETPLHKANFIKLVESGTYDSTIFHRVIQGFMIQGGDIYAGKAEQEPETGRIPAEIVEGFFHKKGELAAARQGDQINPDRKSSSSQFYIVHGRTWTEEELTIDQNMLNQGLGQLFQMGGYDTLRQQFIDLQTEGKIKEMNELALAQRDLVEQTFGVSLAINVSPEKLEAYTKIGGVPHLDGEYTVFGRVVEGLDVIDKIASVPTAVGDKPVADVTMTMEIVTMPKKEVTEKYGYKYPTTK